MSLDGAACGALRVASRNEAERLEVGRVPMANGTIAPGIAANPGLNPFLPRHRHSPLDCRQHRIPMIGDGIRGCQRVQCLSSFSSVGGRGSISSQDSAKIRMQIFTQRGFQEGSDPRRGAKRLDGHFPIESRVAKHLLEIANLELVEIVGVDARLSVAVLVPVAVGVKIVKGRPILGSMRDPPAGAKQRSLRHQQVCPRHGHRRPQVRRKGVAPAPRANQHPAARAQHSAGILRERPRVSRRARRRRSRQWHPLTRQAEAAPPGVPNRNVALEFLAFARSMALASMSTPVSVRGASYWTVNAPSLHPRSRMSPASGS
jgi:hypothetical protein